MYKALVRRDASYDGIFVAAVKTTGIFCRPTCPGKKPREENVEFFPSPAAALHAGYRPCLRCRPMDRERPPEWVRSLMREIERQPTARFTDEQLRGLRIEPARARRYFKRHYGMTFHAYHRARRVGLALRELRRTPSARKARGSKLDDVGGRHGFQSISGFRDAFARLFGEPPGRAVEGLASCLTARWIDTPLGSMLAFANDEGLHLLEFTDRRGMERQVALLRRRVRAVVVPGDHKHLDTIAAELREYFDGTLRRFRTPLVMQGSVPA
jgi:AraC family transcriptional regulator, regulatory protein of adaptative response / methylated-DNA-[protein]-cysteine methyltransferase